MSNENQLGGNRSSGNQSGSSDKQSQRTNSKKQNQADGVDRKNSSTNTQQSGQQSDQQSDQRSGQQSGQNVDGSGSMRRQDDSNRDALRSNEQYQDNELDVDETDEEGGLDIRAEGDEDEDEDGSENGDSVIRNPSRNGRNQRDGSRPS